VSDKVGRYHWVSPPRCPLTALIIQTPIQVLAVYF